MLSLRGREVPTTFDLIGDKEDDMTAALGWCLAQSRWFLQEFLREFAYSGEMRGVRILLQEYEANTGITDIEIHIPGRLSMVIEAKRGFEIPSRDQLERYATRLNGSSDPLADKHLAILANSDRKSEWLAKNAPSYVSGVSVTPISWRKVTKIARTARKFEGTLMKRTLDDLSDYIKRVAVMRDINSNWVYVVSLGRYTFGGKTTFVDVVEQHQKYFHPVGGDRGGWPTEPPNYIAFRYDGALQSIHHIDDYEVITDFGPHFPSQPSEEVGPHFLYHLGPPIRPPKHTPTGARWRNNRIWCFIDTLLSEDTVYDAKKATDARTS